MNIHCIFGGTRDRYLIDLIPFYIVLKDIFSKMPESSETITASQ
jgi:hypothetical protein